MAKKTDVLVIPKKHKRAWFEVRIDGDATTYRLPKLQHLDLDIVEKIRKITPKLGSVKTGKPKTDVRQADLLRAVGILTEVMERYAPGLAEKLDQDQMGFLFQAWSDDSKVKMGESLASPTS